jgi:hypothetical protein
MSSSLTSIRNTRRHTASTSMHRKHCTSPLDISPLWIAKCLLHICTLVSMDPCKSSFSSQRCRSVLPHTVRSMMKTIALMLSHIALHHRAPSTPQSICLAPHRTALHHNPSTHCHPAAGTCPRDMQFQRWRWSIPRYIRNQHHREQCTTMSSTLMCSRIDLDRTCHYMLQSSDLPWHHTFLGCSLHTSC